ncbi:FAD-dependent oxidoreductase [Ruegeria sp. HKCCD6228]|uniref:FAD-dependent oxidoreductase n=1 Tax=Ruegeria atlantica TaxID=81569 RepID=A0AA90YX04_9RHOB|nr:MULTISPECIES: FAD-binding oxidoreductase [Ruegeria]NOC92573.1 FAD-dependent oxidoreductase [Ruegeria sp. HKCCD6604]NOD99763.1 FAD-dependent oxidoreductase [Ruegeria sp. HKCCD6228]NOE20843.1 FAD-dependent oxidoreductase [Ruegeria atlantica]
MSDKKTIAIIGAGIVGVSAAVWLQRDGHNVILFDKAGPGEGTSHGNGGVLASCSIIPVTVPGLLGKAPKMLLSSSQPLFLKWGYLPKLLPWLRQYLSHANVADVERIAAALTPIVGDSLNDHKALATGTRAEKWIVPSDYLFLYENRAHFEQDALGWGIRRKNGFDWEELEGKAFHDYDPVFSPDIGFAAKLSNHGHITDPGQYVKDLAAHVEAGGGRIIRANVEDVTRENGRVTGVRAGGETIACDTAIVTAGVWSGPLAKRLGVSVPLESERGYHLELVAPSAMPRSPVMVASGKFVATPMDGRIRLAGIVEFGGLDAPPSRAPFELMRRNARAAFPGITWKEEVEWMGHRPAPADSIPIIGDVPGIKGAYMGFGHHHIGLTGGPKTGRLLAQMIAGRTPNTDVSVYAPSRFAT